MKFFKQFSYDITKLFIYQVGMTVFGLILTFATIMSRNGSRNTFTLIAGIFSACFYLYLVYAAVWDIGARDKIRIEAGRKKQDFFHCLAFVLFSLQTFLCHHIINTYFIPCIPIHMIQSRISISKVCFLHPRIL